MGSDVVPLFVLYLVFDIMISMQYIWANDLQQRCT